MEEAVERLGMLDITKHSGWGIEKWVSTKVWTGYVGKTFGSICTQAVGTTLHIEEPLYMQQSKHVEGISA